MGADFRWISSVSSSSRIRALLSSVEIVRTNSSLQRALGWPRLQTHHKATEGLKPWDSRLSTLSLLACNRISRARRGPVRSRFSLPQAWSSLENCRLTSKKSLKVFLLAKRVNHPSWAAHFLPVSLRIRWMNLCFLRCPLVTIQLKNTWTSRWYSRLTRALAPEWTSLDSHRLARLQSMLCNLGMRL